MSFDKNGLNPLAMSSDEMRELGYRAIERIVEHVEQLSAKPATRMLSPAEADRRLGNEVFADPAPSSAQVLEELCNKAMSGIMHLDHPRFFGFIPGPGHFVGAIGNLISSGFNVFGGTWLESSAITHLELQTTRLLAEACGLPKTSCGTFLSGGSMANLSALATARHDRFGGHNPRARIYCSTQTHGSVARAMRILGFADHQLRKVRVDDNHRLDVESLAAAITQDAADGRIPLAVVANAGTTNTGAVDPLPEIATVCREKGIWLHVDAAYGGAVVLCPRRKDLLAGIEFADSITIDPHKWLFQPYGIGCLLVRNQEDLTKLYGMTADYLSETKQDTEAINLFDHGPELTRRSRGLSLWFTLRTMGQERIAAAIERGFLNAEHAEYWLDHALNWQVVTPAQMGIVTFRFAGNPNDAANDRATLAAAEALRRDGTAMVSATQINDRPVLRMCTINPATTSNDICHTFETLDRLALGDAG